MSAKSNQVDISYLRKRLHYNPISGELFWLPYEGMPDVWLVRFAGKKAFTTVNTHGYYQGSIDYIKFRAHRVAWAIYYGEWPTEQIDHINGIKTDNRICNLRVVTHQENMLNKPKQSNNTSGITGVHWRSDKNKWQARIKFCGKLLHLGYFDNLEDAETARQTALQIYGFTERHGKTVEIE